MLKFLKISSIALASYQIIAGAIFLIDYRLIDHNSIAIFSILIIISTISLFIKFLAAFLSLLAFSTMIIFEGINQSYLIDSYLIGSFLNFLIFYLNLKNDKN